MKKILALTMALMLLISLTACGGTEPESTQPTPPTGNETPATDPEKTPEVQTAEGFSFPFQGMSLVPGAAFDMSAMPEALSQFEVPSCAIEGTDTVYNYDIIEVTVFDDGTTPLIYSIFVMDANTPTAEGLYMGDSVETVESIYGTDYTENGTEMVYEKGSTELHLLTDNGFVTSIEYRMITG